MVKICFSPNISVLCRAFWMNPWNMERYGKRPKAATGIRDRVPRAYNTAEDTRGQIWWESSGMGLWRETSAVWHQQCGLRLRKLAESRWSRNTTKSVVRDNSNQARQNSYNWRANSSSACCRPYCATADWPVRCLSGVWRTPVQPWGSH